MKNFWLKKNEKKNYLCHGTRGDVPSITEVFNGKFQEAVQSGRKILKWFSPICSGRPFGIGDPAYIPVVEELPQGNKTHVMQVKVCPLTGVKHNFKMQEGK
jgi:hypothetical protein